MLKFLVQVFKSLYLLNPWMDLVDTLPDVRYWSEVLCCAIKTHISDLEVCLMLDTGLKFCDVPSQPTSVTLRYSRARACCACSRCGTGGLYFSSIFREWLGRAMVLGSFQFRGILLLWHMVGQWPAVLAAGAGWVGCFWGLYSSHLSYLPFLMLHLFGDGWTY